jgi:arylsulfatase A-like enzyme
MRAGRRGVTRRGLLRAGGAGAAGAALAGPLVSASRAQGPGGEPEGDRNALLIVSSNTRADFVGAFEDADDLADTPNLDQLAGQSLRFEQAVPESMPTVPARRAILTGMRSFPFRDWQRTDQMPPEPGWNPIFDHRQPIVTDVMRSRRVTTAYATDNPFLIGPAFANFRDTLDDFRGQDSQAAHRVYNEPLSDAGSSSEVRPLIAPGLRGTPAEARLREYVAWNRANRQREEDYSAARVVRDGIDLLREMQGRQPFFLGVDLFDPMEPFDPPSSYLRRSNGAEPVLPIPPEPGWARLEELGLTEAGVERVRELYAAEVTFVDAWIGRLLDELERLGLADNTLVYYLSDHGVALGERGVMGRPPDPHDEVYRIPYMIRDPRGRRAGDRTEWFASTHDVAPTLLSWLGLTIPGKMEGEDLTAFFDDFTGEDDDDDKDVVEGPRGRRHFTSAIGTSLLAGGEDYLMIATGSGTPDGPDKRVYEVEEDFDDDGDEDESVERPELVDRLWQEVLTAAGGTLPEFRDGAVQRPHALVQSDEIERLGQDDELNPDEQDPND